MLLYSVLQIVIWFIIPAVRSSHSTNNALVLIVLLQYVPRLYLIFPLSSQIIKATGVVTKTAWAGAAYNLILYMLASHVCSFFYYYFFKKIYQFNLTVIQDSVTNARTMFVLVGLGGIMVFVVHRTVHDMLEVRMQKGIQPHEMFPRLLGLW